LTIELSMIAIITPSMTVVVTNATGGSGRGSARAVIVRRGRSTARDAMTLAPGSVSRRG
jgi:hypothetical protein